MYELVLHKVQLIIRKILHTGTGLRISVVL